MKTLHKGPKGRFFFGSAADFKRDQLGFYESCARENGDFVQTRLGPVRMLLVYHPDAIEELLVTRNRDFTKSLGLRRLRPLVGDGLFLSEGDTWLRQRRLVQPAFHRQRLAGTRRPRPGLPTSCGRPLMVALPRPPTWPA